MRRELPRVTAHERMDFKRCQMKWFWHWRKGLIPKNKTYGALDLGTWFHDALAIWYGKGLKRNGNLLDHYRAIAGAELDRAADTAPDHVLEQAEELFVLGEAMIIAYSDYWGDDPTVNVLVPEFALDFEIADETGRVIAIHKLRPDLIFMDENGDVWLMEHKTAKSIQTDHLPIDDQARPYGSMAEPALRKLKLIGSRHKFRGIRYNFVRKTLPDDRPQNAEGLYLNQNGTVSKRQPPPQFVRKAVTLTTAAKLRTLTRVQSETIDITIVTSALRNKRITREQLSKTPHKSCAKTCEFFDMCVADENGTDIRDMEQVMFRKENPYLYAEEHATTDEHVGFEMG